MTEKTKIYIVGEESSLLAKAEEPRRFGDSYMWRGTQCMFRAARGVLQEFRAFHGGGRVIARVLPPDLEAPLATIDKEIARCEAALKGLRASRRAMLRDAIPRAKRVRITNKKEA